METYFKRCNQSGKPILFYILFKKNIYVYVFAKNACKLSRNPHPNKNFWIFILEIFILEILY